MAVYEYICSEEKCTEHKIIKQVNIPMAEYTQDKLPKCEKCGAKSSKVFSVGMIKSFEGIR